MPLEQVRSWPISAVLRGDGVYFKAVCPLFRQEPAVTAALGSPRLLAADHDRGWMLMEALPPAEADHHAALRALAKVHRAWASRIAEALELGARDRRSASELPHTLVHGDFHPGNVLGSTIIDWSDAAIANPLFDVNHYLLNAGDEDRDELVATYAEAWPEYDVAAAVAACEAETYEYIARSYALITDSLADEDEWWFADAESAWLRRASDVRAGRRPSPDT
jgi:thiamine kinase-like enzyme